MKCNAFKTLEKTIIYKDNVLGFRRDKVLTPNKDIIQRKVVEYHPSSVIVPLKEKPPNEVLLIRHFRYPIGKYLWEVPGGMRKKDESPEDCAIREFNEETGYDIHDVKHLITFFPEPAFTDQILSVYMGTITENKDSQNPLVAEEEIRESRLFKFEQVLGMIKRGEIGSSWSIIGILLAQQEYNNNKRSENK